MKFSKSILNLFAEFKDLPFGKYIIQVDYDTTTGVREYCFANYTERDGLSLNCCEFFSLEDEFTFEIYSEDFMENAFMFYNHELEKNL
jgi:hypothetical protein